MNKMDLAEYDYNGWYVIKPNQPTNQFGISDLAWLKSYENIKSLIVYGCRLRWLLI